ncbi:MAG: hypothetical protein IPN71_08880 [Fibrobacteres bacterium]|nr:hypothetical protein [Fibrobacterota bacterium]
MPFYCPHQDGTTEICHRLGGLACRVGQPGWALFGKAARLDDEPLPPSRVEPQKGIQPAAGKRCMTPEERTTWEGRFLTFLPRRRVEGGCRPGDDMCGGWLA